MGFARLGAGLRAARIAAAIGLAFGSAAGEGRANPASLCIQTAHEGRYCSLEIDGWQVYVSAALTRHLSLARDVVELLTVRLAEAARAFPPRRLSELRRVPIWIEDKSTGATSFYHLAGSPWPRANGYPDAKMGSFEIPDPHFFLRIRTSQPSIIKHELAHAYHDQVLGYQHPGILNAYKQALEQGLYRTVRRNDGTNVRAYALTNHHEYFAELTEAYFGTNDFFPFRRAELRAYDPVGFEAVRAAWEDQPEMALTVVGPAGSAASGTGGPSGCRMAEGLRSLESKDPARLVFRNATLRDVRMFWLDFQGNWRAYALVSAGALHIQPTYSTHPWLLAEPGGRCLAIVMPEKSGSYVALAP